MASAAGYDRLIRDIYVAARKGPLRLKVGAGGLPPFLQAGDTVELDRAGLEGARPGDILGLQREGEAEIRLFRLIERRGANLLVFAGTRFGEVEATAVRGRAVRVLRGGVEQPLDAALDRVGLAWALARAGGRKLLRRARLTRQLSGIYWSLTERFEQGVSETGDLLITERCPVGCRFCIYSCVTSGTDMSPELAGKAARAFHHAGVPLVRLLGGEPFLSVPHLIRCFRAVRESYPPDRIAILTSGYFGTSEEQVRSRMEPLVREGLHRVQLSFDTFHLERYPIACYERVLAWSHSRGLDLAMVIHFSDGLERSLEALLDLHRRFGFAVRLSTVSREGDAARLAEWETSVSGFEPFRDALLAVPGLKLVPEERSCFRWTVFPGGQVHFCCKEGARNRAGELLHEEFGAVQERLRERTSRNRLNVLRFALGHTGEVSGNPCLTCPMDGGLG